MKSFWKDCLTVLKVTGFLLLVCVGGWLVWKYFLRKLLIKEVASELDMTVTNPQAEGDALQAENIEAALNRLTNKTK